MTKLIVLVLALSACSYVNSFFISNPFRTSLEGSQYVNKTICQSTYIDLSTMSVTSEKIPYLKCPNDGLLVINRATLVLSTSRMCPLQFEGAGNTNVEASCKNPATLVNQDATTILKALCQGKTECVFNWNDLASLSCNDLPYSGLRNIPVNDQALQLEFICSDKRNKFLPFANRLYSTKFRQTGNGQRKLSQNRLKNL